MEKIQFSKTHEWVKWLDETTVEVGLSEYAAHALGDIVFVSIESGAVKCGTQMGDVESVKAVSEIFAPVSGDLVEVNSEVEDNPALINENPMGTWICRIENVVVEEELLSEEAYNALEKE